MRLPAMAASFAAIVFFASGPAHATAANPIGFHDHADARATHGWACDTDDFDAPLRIDFFVDGGAHIGSTRADRPRESAVGDLCGGNPAHGFHFVFPASLRDGRAHTIYAYAAKAGGGSGAILRLSPKTLPFPAETGTAKGRHEAVDADGMTTGWACDPADFRRPLAIKFYADGSYVGSTLANLTRDAAVAEHCGGFGAHGFSFELPPSLKDGYRHTLQAVAVSANGASEALLPQSPLEFGFPFLDYFKQPTIAAEEVAARIFATERPPVRTFVARLHAMGAQANAARVTWDVGRYTGFSPVLPLPDYQRGPSDNGVATAVQLQGDTAGIWINSASVPFAGEILPVVVEQTWSVEDDLRPWRAPANHLSYAFELQLPHAARSGGAETYATAVFLFRDALSGKSFWMSILVFDLRGDEPAEDIFVDGCSTCTRLLIASSSFRPNGTFGSKTAASAAAQGMPWAGFKKFDYRISKKQFAAMLSRIHWYDPAFSLLPENYRLVHFNFNPEIYAPAGSGAAGSIGLSIKNIRIGLYHGSD